ncbi:kinase-like protein [Phanerochaete sordida]|uniref:Kinase-like protein n=1 Tax=Phanerochaete sordida TaxID=48140 RepID=A0A9P3LES9_9APHY|nr:kinase-like protein [Phanerochaete sordida]
MGPRSGPFTAGSLKLPRPTGPPKPRPSLPLSSTFCCVKCRAVVWTEGIARLHIRIKHTAWILSSQSNDVISLMSLTPRTEAHMLYEHTSDFIARKALALGWLQESRAATSYRVLEALMDTSDRPSSSSLINHLLRVPRHRTAVLEVASSLGDSDPELLNAIMKDEKKISDILCSMTDADKSAVELLERSSAADFLDLLDLVMHSSSSTSSDPALLKFKISRQVKEMQPSLRRLFVRLCQSSNSLPHRLQISNVQLTSSVQVAAGAYGVIHRGKYGEKEVALKSVRVLHEYTVTTKEKSRKSFIKEIAINRTLDHPNICPLIGICESPADSICVVLPWMENGNIQQFLEPTRWTTMVVMRLINQVFTGLSYLHERNVVHGDLHAGNILIDAFGNVKICDFGLANFADSGNSCSTAQPGATRCMAPEILDPSRFSIPRVQHTPASDVYSLGQVSWQIYSSQPPFPKMSTPQALFAIVDGKTQERSDCTRPIPDELWSVMQHCWQYQPAERSRAMGHGVPFVEKLGAVFNSILTGLNTHSRPSYSCYLP